MFKCCYIKVLTADTPKMRVCVSVVTQSLFVTGNSKLSAQGQVVQASQSVSASASQLCPVVRAAVSSAPLPVLVQVTACQRLFFQ